MNESENNTQQTQQGNHAGNHKQEKRNIPPPAPLVLRIGVTGHRPEPETLPASARKRPAPDISTLRTTIKAILEIVSFSVKGIAETSGRLFDLTPTPFSQPWGGTLRIISALASGADQWAAFEALDLGFELQSVLPFQRDEYLKDFKAPTEAEAYRELLDKSSSILELDGKAVYDSQGNWQPESQSYEAVGRALLNQTDLLIAIWDGKESHGRGGTGQVVREALQNGIPVIWIPWSSSEKWHLYSSYWHLLEEPTDIQGDSDRLAEIIQKLLLPPDEATQWEIEMGKDLREDYFREKQKKGNFLLGFWLLFRDLVCGKLFKRGGVRRMFEVFHVRNFEDLENYNSSMDWQFRKSGKAPLESPFDDKIRSWVDGRYLKHYAWANGLSVFYGNLHRSAFLVNYFMSAIAVFLALICIAHQVTGKAQTGWIISELVVIIGILALTRRGHVRSWHKRWIDYRTLAEQLRLAKCMVLFGGRGQQLSYEGHLTSYGNPANTWMNWHYLAIERAAGVPPVSFTTEYLSSCQEFWKESLCQDQINYHKSSFFTFKKLDQRLHNIGSFLFVATLVACSIHLAHIWLEGNPRFDFMPSNTGGYMTMLCAFLPALGAAFAAIRSQGEVQRLTQHSKAMEENLEQLQLELASIPVLGNSLNSARLRAKAERISQLMTNEMLDWRVIFQEHPLGLPV